MAPIIETEIPRNKTLARTTLNSLKSALERSARHFKCLQLIFRSFKTLIFMENPLVAGFLKIQHEEKFGRGAAKRLRAKLVLPTAIRQPR
jgi:hypothetical protein